MPSRAPEAIGPRRACANSAPLNSIWEGSDDVICPDILRAIAKEPDCLESLREEIAAGASTDRRLWPFASALDHSAAIEMEAPRNYHAARLNRLRLYSFLTKTNGGA
jgi:hypothetical protein